MLKHNVYISEEILWKNGKHNVYISEGILWKNDKT